MKKKQAIIKNYTLINRMMFLFINLQQDGNMKEDIFKTKSMEKELSFINQQIHIKENLIMARNKDREILHGRMGITFIFRNNTIFLKN